jgi:hypothetical protein
MPPQSADALTILCRLLKKIIHKCRCLKKVIKAIMAGKPVCLTTKQLSADEVFRSVKGYKWITA